MGNTPTYRDDKTTLPLQAADLYAYWIRQWELDGIDDGVEKLKFPWKAERNLPRLKINFNEADFRIEFNKIFDPAVQKRMGIDPSKLSSGVGNTWRTSGWTGGASSFLQPTDELEK